MQTYRIETTLDQQGELRLHNLPFQKGELIEIVIFRQSITSAHKSRYPLRGSILRYVEPMEPVALDDWEVLS